MSSDSLCDDETFRLPKSSRLKSSSKGPGQGSTRLLRSQSRKSLHLPKITESPVSFNSPKQKSLKMRNAPSPDSQGPPSPKGKPLPQEVPQQTEMPIPCLLNKGLPPRIPSTQDSSQDQNPPNHRISDVLPAGVHSYDHPCNWISPDERIDFERWKGTQLRNPFGYRPGMGAWQRPPRRLPEEPQPPIQPIGQNTRRVLITSYRSDKLLLEHLQRGQKRLREEYEVLEGELDENIEAHGIDDKQHNRLRRVRVRIHDLMGDLEGQLRDLEGKRNDEYNRILDCLTPTRANKHWENFDDPRA